MTTIPLKNRFTNKEVAPHSTTSLQKDMRLRDKRNLIIAIPAQRFFAALRGARLPPALNAHSCNASW